MCEGIQQLVRSGMLMETSGRALARDMVHAFHKQGDYRKIYVTFVSLLCVYSILTYLLFIYFNRNLPAINPSIYITFFFPRNPPNFPPFLSLLMCLLLLLV